LYSEEALNKLRKSNHKNALVSYDRDALQFSMERIARFAMVLIDEAGFLKNIIEKPTLEDTILYQDELGKLRVSMNIFKFDGSMISDYIINCPVHSKRNEKELPTALLNMVKDYPKSVHAIAISEHVPDLTSKEDIVILKDHIVKNYSTMNWD
jgi:glucose-1-phosphate adenylyltransferase